MHVAFAPCLSPREAMGDFERLVEAVDAHPEDIDHGKGAVAPGIAKLTRRGRERIIGDLAAVARVHELVAHVCCATGAEAFTAHAHLGISLSLHDHYMDAEHRMHIDVPRKRRSVVHRFRPTHGGVPVRHCLGVTFVIYLCPDDAQMPALLAGTCLAPDHAHATPIAPSHALFVPCRTGFVLVFDGAHYHAVTPNPGIRRGTVVHRVLFTRAPSSPPVELRDVFSALHGGALGPCCTSRLVESHPYDRSIVVAHALAAILSPWL